ncbi:MAG: 50S ribosomal protein L28 [Candidatus Improbicoccus devescovinae]|nr:MAG: 50S ribosomal protein L28 [Candidatus Improbicoccus devescovinae]
MICKICGKKVWFGIQVSHSHKRSTRTWRPNVREAYMYINGQRKRTTACAKCIRSGKLLVGA